MLARPRQCPCPRRRVLILYRVHCPDLENTFELTEEPGYIVVLSTDPRLVFSKARTVPQMG